MDQKPTAKEEVKQGSSGGSMSQEGNLSQEENTDQRETGDQSSDDSEEGSGSQEEPAKREGDYSNLERLRKEKRLAMNRASARNRRKYKKQKLESLEDEVEELTKTNQGLRHTIQTLSSRVTQLESELEVARSTIARLSGSSARVVPGGPAFSAPLTSVMPNATATSQHHMPSSGISSRVASDGTGHNDVSFGSLPRRHSGSVPLAAQSSTLTRTVNAAAVATATATESIASNNTGVPSIEQLSSYISPRNPLGSDTDLLAHIQQSHGGSLSVPQALEFIQRARIGLPMVQSNRYNLGMDELLQIVGQGGTVGDGILDDLRRLAGMPTTHVAGPDMTQGQAVRDAQYNNLMGMLGGTDGTTRSSLSNTLGMLAVAETQNAQHRGAAATSNLASMLSLADASTGTAAAAARASLLARTALDGQNSQHQPAQSEDGASTLFAVLRGNSGSTSTPGTAPPRRRLGRDP